MNLDMLTSRFLWATMALLAAVAGYRNDEIKTSRRVLSIVPIGTGFLAKFFKRIRAENKRVFYKIRKSKLPNWDGAILQPAS